MFLLYGLAVPGAIGAAEPSAALKAADECRAAYERGNYAEAARFCEKAVASAEPALGETPPLAPYLTHLAEAYRSLGNYERALPLFRRALSIREKSLPADHPDTTAAQNDLAVAYLYVGDYHRASVLLESALAARQRVLGLTHRDTIESSMNLAAVRTSERKYDEAVRQLEAALQALEASPDRDERVIATAHNNLAVAYARMGGHEGLAIAHLRQALEIAKAHLGPEHPGVATYADQLAGEYWQAGNETRARENFQLALEIRQHALGEDHFDTVASANRLATFYQSNGQYRDALALYARALPAQDRTFANVFAVASEEQKLLFVQRSAGHYLAALSLINRRFRTDDAAIRFGMELVLRRKGIVKDAQARTQEVLAAHLKGGTLESWQRLTQYIGELSPLLVSSVGQQMPSDAARIAALETAIGREQDFLRDRVRLVAQELAQRRVTLPLVTARMPSNGVLVEFVRIVDWDEQRGAWSAVQRYLAFALGSNGAVTLVDLGEAGILDYKIDTVRKILAQFPSRDPEKLADPDKRKAFVRSELLPYAARSDAALAELYDLLLAPLASAIGSARHLIVSPDGMLNTVPFAALRTPDGRYLTETTVLSYVACGRDLLRGKSDVTPSVDLLLVANPAFGTARSRASARGSTVLARGLVDNVWNPLPGTAEEAERIRGIVTGTKKILLDRNATESAVRAVASPKILHLATHGFFFDEDATGSTRAGDERADPLFAMKMNVHSGLVLAGANSTRKDRANPADDGWLFASEVANMDLHGTDLVVLSACDSGLGVQAASAANAGDGVFGLRRAFVLAGARNLVMSLWKVDDEITRDLMVDFYRSYVGGSSAPEALRASQAQTMSRLRDRYRAAIGESITPAALWAPFIVQQTGD